MFNKWRELSSRKQKNIVLGSLGAIILLMAIGYAAFSTQLNINGTSNISSNWDIRITNITSDLHGGATNAVEPTYDNENGLTASFSTNLVSPGDYAEYTVTVRNNGDIDATLTNIEITDSNNPAIVFETSGLEEGDNLLKQTEDELIVKVSYSDSVTSQPANTTSNITVTLTYEQATGATPPVQTETAANQLKALVTTTGDGLYADTYEEGRYIYKGASPNNYITFNNETWRIISVISVENDGTIKIIRNESIGNMQLDSSNSNNWEKPTSLNTYLNGEYLENLINSNIVVIHNYNVGSIIQDNNDLAGQIADESKNIWKGKVGLIAVSDYLMANSNISQCSSFNLNNNNRAYCINTNWIYNIVPEDNFLWTITSISDNTSYNCFVDGYYNPHGSIGVSNANSSGGIAPALYLSSDITLQGEGTLDNPYQIQEI